MPSWTALAPRPAAADPVRARDAGRDRAPAGAHQPPRAARRLVDAAGLPPALRDLRRDRRRRPRPAHRPRHRLPALARPPGPQRVAGGVARAARRDRRGHPAGARRAGCGPRAARAAAHRARRRAQRGPPGLRAGARAHARDGRADGVGAAPRAAHRPARRGVREPGVRALRPGRRHRDDDRPARQHRRRPARLLRPGHGAGGPRRDARAVDGHDRPPPRRPGRRAARGRRRRPLRHAHGHREPADVGPHGRDARAGDRAGRGRHRRRHAVPDERGGAARRRGKRSDGDAVDPSASATSRAPSTPPPCATTATGCARCCAR